MHLYLFSPILYFSFFVVVVQESGFSSTALEMSPQIVTQN